MFSFWLRHETSSQQDIINCQGPLPLRACLAQERGEGQSKGGRQGRGLVAADCWSNAGCRLPFLFSTSYKYYLRMKTTVPASGKQRPSPEARKDSKLYIFQNRPSAEKISHNGQIPLSQLPGSLASSKSTTFLSSPWHKTTEVDHRKYEQASIDHRRNLQRLRCMIKRMGTGQKQEGETGCARVFRLVLQLHQKRQKELYRVGFCIIKQRFHTAHHESGHASYSRTAAFKTPQDRKSIWSSRQEQQKQILRGSKTFQIDDELLTLVDDPQKPSYSRQGKERPVSLEDSFGFHQITPKKSIQDSNRLIKKQQPQITPRNRSKQHSDAEGRSCESADGKANHLVRFKKKMLKNKVKRIEQIVTPVKLAQPKLEVTQQVKQSIIVEEGFKEERWQAEATQRKSRLTEQFEDTYKMGRNCLRDRPRLTKRQSQIKEELIREQQREKKRRQERLAQLAKIINDRRIKRQSSLTPSSIKSIDISRRNDPMVSIMKSGRKSNETKKQSFLIPKISLNLKRKIQKTQESPQRSPTSSYLHTKILQIMKPTYQQRTSKRTSNEFIRIEDSNEVQNSYYADHYQRSNERLVTGSSISHKLECIIRKSPHLQ